MEVEFARSLAGHDKDRVYFVCRREGGYAYLANGEGRTLAEPKKKNEKHVQPIKKLPEDVTDCLQGGVTDLTVKRAIKIYESYLKGIERS